MPTKVYFKGGANVEVKGDSMATAVYAGPPVVRWFRRWVGAVAMNGHDLRFKKRDVLCYEHQPEAEFAAQQEEKRRKAEQQRKAEEERLTASHCRRCGSVWPREYEYCAKCSAPLVKKEPPKPAIPS